MLKNDKCCYTLSSVFPTKEINDVVRGVIDRDNKRDLCYELGIFDDNGCFDVDSISWEEIIELSNKKEGKKLIKSRSRSKRGNNYGK